MEERPAASPLDAKAVYDSMLAIGGKPSLRNIAKSLNASGKYSEPVRHQQVARWKKHGWKEGKRGRRFNNKPEERAEAAVDAVVLPALTGDPTIRLGEMEDEVKAELKGILVTDPDVKALVESVASLTDVNLLKERLRLRAITGILIERMVHAKIAILMETPVALTQLEAALAGDLGALMMAAQKSQEVALAGLKTIDLVSDDKLSWDDDAEAA